MWSLKFRAAEDHSPQLKSVEKLEPSTDHRGTYLRYRFTLVGELHNPMPKLSELLNGMSVISQLLESHGISAGFEAINHYIDISPTKLHGNEDIPARTFEMTVTVPDAGYELDSNSRKMEAIIDTLTSRMKRRVAACYTNPNVIERVSWPTVNDIAALLKGRSL